MSVKCAKVCFSSQGKAQHALRVIGENSTGLVPTRSYWCGKCKAWHLTSRASGAGRRTKRRGALT